MRPSVPAGDKAETVGFTVAQNKRHGANSIIPAGTVPAGTLPAAVLLAGVLLVASSPGWPGPALDRGSEYRECMRLAHTKPASGFERALSWRERDGDRGARHCAATALVGLGDFEAAAKRLEALGRDLEAETPAAVRAQILSQAAQAWLDAGKSAKAQALFNAAVDLAPGDPEIRIDRAIARAAAARYQDAIIDLSAAVIADPASADALTLRANAYRLSGRPANAMADIARALKLTPDRPDALLERGILRRLDGDRAGAARDWRRILKLHGGDPAAEAARRNLAHLRGGPAR